MLAKQIQLQILMAAVAWVVGGFAALVVVADTESDYSEVLTLH